MNIGGEVGVRPFKSKDRSDPRPCPVSMHEPFPADLSGAFEALATRKLGQQASFRAYTPSTMTDAATLARDGAPSGTLVVADHQTAGRGRQGRSWNDAPGQNLLLSFVWRDGRPDAWPRALLGVALGVAETLDAMGLAATVKWPNDVRLGGRKVAGTIAQAAGSALIVGLGVNVNQTDFPDDLVATATSLALHAGQRLERATVLAALLPALERRLDDALSDHAETWLPAFTARLDGLGKTVRLVEGETMLTGTFTSVGEDGALRLLLPDGRARACYAGDVHLLPSSTP